MDKVEQLSEADEIPEVESAQMKTEFKKNDAMMSCL